MRTVSYGESLDLEPAGQVARRSDGHEPGESEAMTQDPASQRVHSTRSDGSVIFVPPNDPLHPALLSLVKGRGFDVVWRSDIGGVVLRLSSLKGETYLKWYPRTSGLDLDSEVVRLEWARPYVAVPRVVTSGCDEVATWFESASLGADNAVSAARKQKPKETARMIGAGLRVFHDALPVEACPFSWSAPQRVATIPGRQDRQAAEPTFDQQFGAMTLERALIELSEPPELDSVVCHGDACAPNTLISKEGEIAGHVDLLQIGVADRWADLAVASWSTIWNFGRGYERDVYDGYAVEEDEAKVRYYRLLWQLT